MATEEGRSFVREEEVSGTTKAKQSKAKQSKQERTRSEGAKRGTQHPNNVCMYVCMIERYHNKYIRYVEILIEKNDNQK